ncbi:MAG: hypothetical protein M3R57_05040 [Chloroflexota bacterium]|nr:hypothetical protein [Chloroflexota bacterium]
MNEPTTDAVRSGPIRSGSAAGRPRPVDEPEPGWPDGTEATPVLGEANERADRRLLDWVPAAEPGRTSDPDYPIEDGFPHPHWVREPAEHRLATHPVVIAESAVVLRLLVALLAAAFLLGLTVFYPVSPLGH